MMLLLDMNVKCPRILTISANEGLIYPNFAKDNALAQHRDCHVRTLSHDTHNAYLRATPFGSAGSILITINRFHHQSHHNLGSQHQCQGSQP